MKGFFALGFAVLGVMPAYATSDDFNRTDLGKKWVVIESTLSISNDQLVGGFGGLGYDKKSATAMTASADIILGPTYIQYGAVAVGDIADGKDAFAKIQNGDSGTMFTTAAFYDKDNDGSGSFFNLKAPVPSPANLTLSLCGTVATMTIRSAAKTQKYSYDFGSVANDYGSGAGLGTYSNITLDNFKSKLGKSCELDADTVMVSKSDLKDPTRAK